MGQEPFFCFVVFFRLHILQTIFPFVIVYFIENISQYPPARLLGRMAALAATPSVLPGLDTALEIRDFHKSGALYEAHVIVYQHIYYLQKNHGPVADTLQVQHTS